VSRPVVATALCGGDGRASLEVKWYALHWRGQCLFHILKARMPAVADGGYAAAAPDAQFVSATEDQEETAVERNLHMRELSLIIFSGPSLYRHRRFEIIFLYKFYSHKNLKG
jgi:hypothetical protein